MFYIVFHFFFLDDTFCYLAYLVLWQQPYLSASTSWINTTRFVFQYPHQISFAFPLGVYLLFTSFISVHSNMYRSHKESSCVCTWQRSTILRGLQDWKVLVETWKTSSNLDQKLHASVYLTYFCHLFTLHWLVCMDTKIVDTYPCSVIMILHHGPNLLLSHFYFVIISSPSIWSLIMFVFTMLYILAVMNKGTVLGPCLPSKNQIWLREKDLQPGIMMWEVLESPVDSFLFVM